MSRVQLLTKPAELLLNRVPFIGKFAIISVAFLMPAFIGVGVMYNKLNNDVRLVERKQARLVYISDMYDASRPWARCGTPSPPKPLPPALRRTTNRWIRWSKIP